jgi:hypothetical protein
VFLKGNEIHQQFKINGSLYALKKIRALAPLETKILEPTSKVLRYNSAISLQAATVRIHKEAN